MSPTKFLIAVSIAVIFAITVIRLDQYYLEEQLHETPVIEFELPIDDENGIWT